MKQANVSQLKNRLSRYLSYVKRGGIVRVFDRDRAVAELVPVGRATGAGSTELEAILDDLERRGVVRRGSGTLPAELLDGELPHATGSVMDALLAERREGR
jgi:antitoxin (DNA-binding transcriptional repressor) of toxin-antitoxin stability system